MAEGVSECPRLGSVDSLEKFGREQKTKELDFRKIVLLCAPTGSGGGLQCPGGDSGFPDFPRWSRF